MKTNELQLTGKVEDDFYKWYLNWIFLNKTYLSLNFSEDQIINNWKSLNSSEQWGVLQFYFEFKKIDIDYVYDNEVFIINYKYNITETSKKENIRILARYECIKECCTILNQLL